MPAQPNARNWNDVQTALATAAIVTTLGMWNLFATPAKTAAAQTQEPKEPDPTLPPTEPPATPEPTLMPHVKVMFTQVPTQTTNVVPQTQQETKKKKKKKKDNGGGGGGGGGSSSVTQTQSS
jgi:hypothetical protein